MLNSYQKMETPKASEEENAFSKGTNNQYCCCANIIDVLTFQVQIL